MEEVNQSRISVSVHLVTAIIAGWLSVGLGWQLALAVGIGLLLAAGFATERITGKRGIKWWVGNGIFPYIFIWAVTWIYFFNTLA